MGMLDQRDIVFIVMTVFAIVVNIKLFFVEQKNDELKERNCILKDELRKTKGERP